MTQWEDGTIRIAGTRVTLDVIVRQFTLGATAEQIHDSFPAASLKDIYGTIYYYLEHTDAVDAYLYEQQQAAVATRQWVESQPENRVLQGAVTRPAARLNGRMLLLLIDENFNHRILRGLRLRVPALDVVIVRNRHARTARPAAAA